MTRRLTLLGKPGCHLCHEMRTVVERVVAGLDAALVEEDVTSDPGWRRYRLEIPVLLLDGAEIARHRVDEPELRRLLAARGVGAISPSGS
ncbi:MAG TPA: glutaredoxin family protein [Vicinamibacteria bacterium]